MTYPMAASFHLSQSEADDLTFEEAEALLKLLPTEKEETIGQTHIR